MAKKQAVNGERGRWSAKAKREAVLRLLRGEAIDTLSRELKVTAAKLSGWRGAFLAGGEANLKSREADARDDERAQLKQTLGGFGTCRRSHSLPRPTSDRPSSRATSVAGRSHTMTNSSSRDGTVCLRPNNWE
jgi:transposase-like protein